MKRAALLLRALMLGSAASPPPPASPVLQCAAGGAGGDVAISSGTTMVGDDRGYAEEHDARSQSVAAFRIDRHEVTNRDFARFVATTGYVTDAERLGESIVFNPPAAPVPSLDPRLWWKLDKGADWRHPHGPDSSIAGRDYFPVVHVSLAPVGCYQANRFGLRDMIGNAWEWTALRYSAAHQAIVRQPRLCATRITGRSD